MKKGISFSLLCCMVLGISGCGSAKDANKGNFSKAIQSYLDTQKGLCAAIPAKEYPFTLANKGWFADQKKRADALVDAGLLTRRDTQVKADFGNAMQEGSEYQLTEQGNEYRVAGGANTMGGHDAFCSGKYEVVSIENFTEPSDAMGVTISRVNYRYVLKGAADWMGADAVQAAYPEIKKQSEGEIQGKAVLVLTNEGWLHERLFKR